MINRHPILLLALAVGFSQCKVNKNVSSANTTEQRILQEITVKGSRKPAESTPYRASEPRIMDLIHTTLWLSFDYNNQHVLGKAKLTMHPYFYPQKTVKLDAKKFIIHKVTLLQKDTQNLVYTYNDKEIEITLDKTYTRNDTFSIYIEYTARPNEIKDEGSAAISDARGLYFINPLKTDSLKPRQIWSQGETQSNSGWFPTLDVPNEKMTQEIYLTVQKSETSLSNGTLVYSKDNADGTRTDYWQQRLPHAPYLAMIAVGEFTETKDFWRDSIEVNSYLEKDYAPYGKLIFGTTPEMMECFSKRLGFDYPWDKYSQVVVRDFVSGAMENTSAVIHFEPVQHDAREHLDRTWEDIISHELFHHWFGDLVTCESWSNISLNESFATYGEYIWDEYKYGKQEADYNFEDNLRAYLGQQSASRKKLIRFHYTNREDMFDVVSYQKGSRILHMLRDYIGDDAFFASLKLYLHRHQYQTVEVHDLRLAFEEVSGQDLNWFFNQWYFGNGHPVLTVNTTLSEDKKQITLNVLQTQDSLQYGVFDLPVSVDVYNAQGKATRHSVRINSSNWQTQIQSDEPISLMVFDATNTLLAKVNQTKTKEQYAFQFLHAPNYRDKSLAVDALIGEEIDSVSPTLTAAIEQALVQPFFGFRELAIEIIAELPPSKWAGYESRLVKLASSDPKSRVRADAINVLKDWDGSRFMSVFNNGLNDSAYSVVSASLLAISEADGTKALEITKTIESTRNKQLLYSIDQVIANHAQTDYTAFFEKQLSTPSNYNYQVFNLYSEYLLKQDNAIVIAALPKLGEWVQYKGSDFPYPDMAKQSLTVLIKKYQSRVEEADKKLASKKLNEDQQAAVLKSRDADAALIADMQALMGN